MNSVLIVESDSKSLRPLYDKLFQRGVKVVSLSSLNEVRTLLRTLRFDCIVIAAELASDTSFVDELREICGKAKVLFESSNNHEVIAAFTDEEITSPTVDSPQLGVER